MPRKAKRLFNVLIIIVIVGSFSHKYRISQSLTIKSCHCILYMEIKKKMFCINIGSKTFY